MNKVARKGLVTAMVAGGVLASAGYAQADSAAAGETTGSPGVLSGNSVQVPVHVPVNVCGNTVDVIGLLNPTFGNTCANGSGRQSAGATGGSANSAGRPVKHAGAPADESAGGGSRSGGGAHAMGNTTGSPGVVAGNTLKLPLDLPLNLSGNSANVVGVGNPAFGNTAVNSEQPTPPPPPAHQPIPAPPNATPAPDLTPAPVDTVEPEAGRPTLAHTGADGLGWAAGGSAALLLGGSVLYRRARPTALAAARR
jgi:ChpA-C